VLNRDRTTFDEQTDGRTTAFTRRASLSATSARTTAGTTTTGALIRQLRRHSTSSRTSTPTGTVLSIPSVRGHTRPPHAANDLSQRGQLSAPSIISALPVLSGLPLLFLDGIPTRRPGRCVFPVFGSTYSATQLVNTSSAVSTVRARAFFILASQPSLIRLHLRLRTTVLSRRTALAIVSGLAVPATTHDHLHTP
jgi:hypothetical protein